MREVASLRGLFLVGSAEVTVRNDTHFLGLREVASLRELFLVGSAEVTVRNDTHFFGLSGIYHKDLMQLWYC